MERRCVRPLFALILLPLVGGCRSGLQQTAVASAPSSPPHFSASIPVPEAIVAPQSPVVTPDAMLAEGDTAEDFEDAAIDEEAPDTERPSPSVQDLLDAASAQPPTEPDPGLWAALQSDLEAGNYGIPIPLNDRVLSFVQLFQGRLHDFLQDGLTRGSQYLPMIQQVFRAEGLPLDLAYVPLVESAFNPNALSRAKARGVWQFMRGTGVENGLRHDWFIDERADPAKSTVAAAKYLGTLARTFNGDWHLALASYNGGPARVQRAMKRGRRSDFWTLADKPRLLPRETRNYVPMILAAIVIARNPAQYGFEFRNELSQQVERTYETVPLPVPVDLRRIAEWTDTTVEEIRALNPELRRWTTPIRDDAYPLKVPAGRAESVLAKVEESAPQELATLNWYVAKKGDTLPGIARKLRVTRADLAEANGLRTTARIAVGQRLLVPKEAAVVVAESSTAPRSVVTASRDPRPDVVVPAVNATAGGQVRVQYRIRSGDTLGSIARRFNTSVAALRSWNGIAGTRIRAGERLTIYTTSAN